jgi:hypothetical protein
VNAQFVRSFFETIFQWAAVEQRALNLKVAKKKSKEGRKIERKLRSRNEIEK